MGSVHVSGESVRHLSELGHSSDTSPGGHPGPVAASDSHRVRAVVPTHRGGSAPPTSASSRSRGVSPPAWVRTSRPPGSWWRDRSPRRGSSCSDRSSRSGSSCRSSRSPKGWWPGFRAVRIRRQQSLTTPWQENPGRFLRSKFGAYTPCESARARPSPAAFARTQQSVTTDDTQKHV